MSLIQTDRPIGYLSVETNEIITERQIRELYPHVSFASPFSPPEGFTAVYPSLQPEISKAQTIKETTPVEVDGKLVQQWEVADITDTEQLGTILKQVIVDKLEELAAYRWKKETAGIVVNGTIIKTDEVSQAKLTGTWAKSQINPSVVINWKGVDGWVQITKTEIDIIATAVSDHVEACYDKEKEHEDAINTLVDNGATVEQIESYDFTTGWPDNT